MTTWKKIAFDLETIPATAKIFLLQNMSVMVKAGIPLAEALGAIGQQTRSGKLKTILAAVAEDIKQGKTLHESLAPYRHDFGDMFINIIAAGEASGRLENVLHELYIQTQKQHLLATKVRNALAYPVIVLTVMIAIGIFAILFILPNIIGIFQDINVTLPLPTRILIWVGTYGKQYSLPILAAILAAGLIFFRIIRTAGGKKSWDAFLLKVPVLSMIIKQINLARIAQSLSSLIRTDIAIVDTLRLTAGATNNNSYRQALLSCSEEIKKGGRLNEALRNYPHLFPPIMVQMVSVGESSGAIDEVLASLAEFYDEEVTQTLNNLPIIIEPLLVILIGLGVAGIAVSILLPIYSLAENL